MPKEIPGSVPQPIGEPSRSRLLPYWAFVTLALFWMAKYPSAHSVVPHVVGVTNAAAGWLSAVVAAELAGQAKARIIKWWSGHVEISGRLTLRLGKKGEQPPP